MAPLGLSADEASQLQSLAGSRTLPHSIVQRAQIGLACATGVTNTSVAKRFGVRGATVGKWRKLYRYLDHQIAAWLRLKDKQLRSRWGRRWQLLKRIRQ